MSKNVLITGGAGFIAHHVIDKILKDKRVEIIDSCEKTGMVLFRLKYVFVEPLMYLKVINSTQEPDGSYKNYYLCVPPDMKNCKQAVAWTFRMEESQYEPTQET